MSQFRPAPGIARGPQQFSRSQMPPIASPLGPPPSVPQSPESAISEQIQDLAMEIYARLAAKHISDVQVDPERLSYLAQSAQRASLEYFQVLGVQFQEQAANG